MTSAMAVVIVLFLLRALYLRCLVSRHELIARQQGRLVTVELWRRAMLFQCRDGTGDMKLPVPRESRTRLVRFAGVPVWRYVEAIGLPNDAADRISAVAAHEFDGGFSPAFRAGSVGAPQRMAA